MHFHKYPYISNFEFASSDSKGNLKTSLGSFNLKVRASQGGIFHLGVSGKGWKVNDSQAELNFQPDSTTGGPSLKSKATASSCATPMARCCSSRLPSVCSASAVKLRSSNS